MNFPGLATLCDLNQWPNRYARLRAGVCRMQYPAIVGITVCTETFWRNRK